MYLRQRVCILRSTLYKKRVEVRYLGMTNRENRIGRWEVLEGLQSRCNRNKVEGNYKDKRVGF
jgi:hypothetical protein